MRLFPVVGLSFHLVWMAISLAGAKNEPQVLSLPISDAWYGIDGLWSAVPITVGSPQQNINVLVSTTSRDILVVGQDGCSNGNSTTCDNSRGGLFNPTKSTSRQEIGSFNLSQPGFVGNADYGMDNVGLMNDVTAPQTVGVFSEASNWLGVLGLGVTSSNLSSNGPPSLLSSLAQSKTIPSNSYGYTAGAHYRLNGVPSSVTLGGFDANRFDSHDISFDLNPAQIPVVALNGITLFSSPSNATAAGPSNPKTLMDNSQAALFTIDSSTPFLWLPESVCLQFENALGLVYDNTLDLYTFGNNHSQHRALVGRNMSFTFTLANLVGSTTELNITLPYEAFDIGLTYPFPGLNATPSSPATKYFPVRKAADASSYTIGRAFLQETYLVVDYERNNFSTYQAKFNADGGLAMNLIPITPISKSYRYANRRTITGLAITCSALGVTVIVGACLFIYRFRAGKLSWPQFRRRKNNDGSGLHQLEGEHRPRAELDSSVDLGKMSSKVVVVELPAQAYPIYEKE